MILGFFDMLSAIILLMTAFKIVISPLIIIAALYLGIKGFLFIRDIASILDLIASALLLFSFVFPIPLPIMVAIALLLIQKAVFSFF